MRGKAAQANASSDPVQVQRARVQLVRYPISAFCAESHRMKKLSLCMLAMFLGSFMVAPASAENVGSANVSGIVNHVSDNNIKITDGAGHQLSFLIVPKFDQVFSADGKTTYQMRAIKAGQYVKVYYDQKFLGQRHADRILVMRQNNTVKRTE
jgi:hypothetical protein